VVTDKSMSVREVEIYVKKLNKDKEDKKKTDELNAANDEGNGKKGIEVDYMREAQNELTASMGRRVTITRRGKKGKVEIEFFDDDDFNALYETLIKER